MLHWFDKQMQDKEFMCLDKYTIADISALICFDFAKWPKIEIPENVLILKIIMRGLILGQVQKHKIIS